MSKINYAFEDKKTIIPADFLNAVVSGHNAHEDSIEAINTALEDKQKKLTAGDNITIDDDGVISSEGGGYEKPTDGIPKSDLAEDVQTSLGKADTAVQEEDLPTSLPASDVKDWAKADTKPSYTASEIVATDSEGEASDVQTSLTNLAQKINKTTTSAPTALTNNKVESGKVYNITLTDADDSLTIDSWDNSGYESIIYLNVGEDVDVPISYPDTIKYIGSDFSGIESGKNYVISLLNGVFIYGEIN